VVVGASLRGARALVKALMVAILKCCI